MSLTNTQIVDMYKTMIKIRKFESAARDLFADGKIGGFVHLYLGEEAVAAGVCASLTDEDFITSTHRGHGHLLAKDADMNKMMAELFGKETGYCKGKGGSMHIADRSKGILGANGIVGAGHCLSVGAGLTCQYLGTKNVAVCFFGDGSTNNGTFHESMNMASVFKFPVVFICENNGFGISMSQSRHQNIKDVSERAAAYGIPGVTVDGNDVLAVYEAAAEAIKLAREGKGPSLVECKTYRHRGHFEGDPTVYRTKEELTSWLAKDPIDKIEKYMKDNGVLDEAGIDKIKADTDAAVEASIQFAMDSPEPPVEDVVKDVYSDIIEEVWK